jgi:hypothetical protein
MSKPISAAELATIRERCGWHRPIIPRLCDEVERLNAQIVQLIMSRPTRNDRLAALGRINASPEIRRLIQDVTR